MNRAEKAAFIEKLNQEFSNTPHLILAGFSGLSVNQANDLRRRVRAAGGRYRVIKNRLAKRAAAGTPVEALSASFSGPCAVASHDTDPVVLAKTLAEFVKENPQVEFRSGLVDAKETIDAQGVKQLATLPGLPELQAQLLALIQTPATTLVRLIQTPGTQLARVIDAKREAQGEGGEAS